MFDFFPFLNFRVTLLFNVYFVLFLHVICFHHKIFSELISLEFLTFNPRNEGPARLNVL